MTREPIVMAVCSDLAGQVRGKGFPLHEREQRLVKGVGWVPTNIMITCFNQVADGPFGSVGDLLLIPDEEAEVCVDFDDGSAEDRFIIGDLTTLDGEPWQFCPRQMLKSALDDLFNNCGLRLKVAFEHEFWHSGADEESWSGFGLNTFRQHREFAERTVAALRAAGLEPDSFLAEFGTSQFEVTVSPKSGLRAADECIIAREMVRAVAMGMGEKVSFSPAVTGNIGNGLHIHISLIDAAGEPATHDPSGPLGMTALAASFFAGVRKYIPAIVAMTAPSAISYERLQPHRWSAAFNNIANKDREAALRVCPIADLPGLDPYRQFNVEFRAADAAASPYLQLASLVRAGLQGIKDDLPPPTPTETDLSALSDAELEKLGIEKLPQDMMAALDRFGSEPVVKDWFSKEFVDIYTAHKLAEWQYLDGKDQAEIRKLYSQVY